MSIKRRDNKNRVLRTGESQRKDGRYAYKYLDDCKKVHFVYSWKLEKTDKTPYGKKDDLSLREKEKRIKEALKCGVISYSKNITVNTLLEEYVCSKKAMKNKTIESYHFIVKFIKGFDFAEKKICDIIQYDAKIFMIQVKEKGVTYNTANTIKNFLKSAFAIAVKNNFITDNPFDFKLSSVIKNDNVKRKSLSKKEMEQFLEYIKNHKYFNRYYDPIYILFHTGLRISEFVGLSVFNIDMENRIIHIKEQLLRKNTGEYYIESTKSLNGIRDIPMSNEVYLCFKNILSSRRTPQVEPVIDGKSGFLFLDKHGNPTCASNWDRYFNNIYKSYVKNQNDIIYKVTPHICRHTYCSLMVQKGINPKVLQYLMGHSEISTTLDVYSHIRLEDVKNELQQIEKIG